MRPVVGFDLDGTLFDHESAAQSAVGSFVRSQGWPEPQGFDRHWVNLDEVHFRDYAAGLTDLVEQRRRRIRALRDFVGLPDLPPDAVDALFTEYRGHYERQWVPYDDALATLTALKNSGYRLAVLTNGLAEQQEAKIDAIGLRHLFEVVLSASDLPAFKPSPLAFEALCTAMAVSPAEVTFVGDDVAADIEGALAFGMNAVWIDRGTRDDRALSTPRIEVLAQLPLYL
jgi:putative hydrolase of the HAD superfamily